MLYKPPFINMLLYFSLLAIIATAEIITLKREKVLTCVTNADSVSSTVYVNPPIDAGFIKRPSEINNWIADDWTMVNSLHTNQTVVTDKRWEDFTMLHENGHVLINNSLPFSAWTIEDFSINISNSDHKNETSLHITTSHWNFPKNKNSGQWHHYTVIKQGTAVYLISKENVQTFDVGFDPHWLIIKNSTETTTYWKLHNYEFRSATTSTTQGKESRLSVNFTDNLCLSMYVSVDKNSFLTVRLEIGDKVFEKTILGFNEEEDLKKWQRIKIETPVSGEGTISFLRGLKEPKDREGYWAIDDISFCGKNIDIRKTSLADEVPGDYICESLNQDEFHDNINQNVLRCDRPGFLGENCNISCEVVLGANYSYCENHTICQDASSCFCGWGYHGKECTKTCEVGRWGLFCKNLCNPKCQKKCHPSTGECLNLESLQESRRS